MDDLDRAAIYRLHADFCKILGDANRLLMIDVMERGELSVNEMSQKLSLPQSNVSKHLALMRDHGLVVTRRDGPNVYYRLSDTRISQAIKLLKSIQIERIETQRVLAQKSV